MVAACCCSVLAGVAVAFAPPPGPAEAERACVFCRWCGPCVGGREGCMRVGQRARGIDGVCCVRRGRGWAGTARARERESEAQRSSISNWSLSLSPTRARRL